MDPSNPSTPANPQPNPQSVPTPAPSVPTPTQPPATGQVADDAIFSRLRYWLILLGVSAFGEICASFAPLRPAELAVWAGGLILCYRHITKIKSANIDELKQSDKDTMVLYMAIDTVFAQLFYYFRLKKSLPKTGKLAFSIGWKVLVLQLIFVALAGVVLGTLFH